MSDKKELSRKCEVLMLDNAEFQSRLAEISAAYAQQSQLNHVQPQLLEDIE